MKNSLPLIFAILLCISCKKTSDAEFSGEYFIGLYIHPNEITHIVPSSDTTQLELNLDDSNTWKFVPSGLNKYSISPAANTNRVLSGNNYLLKLITKPGVLSNNEKFYIEKSSVNEFFFRSVGSGYVINVLYAEKNNTIWGYGIQLEPQDSCLFIYSNVDTNYCFTNFNLRKK